MHFPYVIKNKNTINYHAMNSPIPLLNVFKWYVLIKLLVICVNCLVKAFWIWFNPYKCPSDSPQIKREAENNPSLCSFMYFNVAHISNAFMSHTECQMVWFFQWESQEQIYTLKCKGIQQCKQCFPVDDVFSLFLNNSS